MRSVVAVGSLALLCAVAARAQDASELYEARSVQRGEGEQRHEVHYRLMRPAVVEKGVRYPLVLFLHGAGERGDDNRTQLKYLPTWMAELARREKQPCFVLAPQCPRGVWWVKGYRGKQADAGGIEPDEPLLAAVQMLRETLAREPVDPHRIYLTGLSMGGFGAWELALRHPDWFAAVVPICGGGDARRAAALAHVPVWAFHGGADPRVPVELTRRMIEALRAAGGKPRYTELEGVRHDSWTPAYRESDVIAWMFQQRK